MHQGQEESGTYCLLPGTLIPHTGDYTSSYTDVKFCLFFTFLAKYTLFILEKFQFQNPLW